MFRIWVAVLLLLLMSTLASCSYSNEICFDIDEQTIKSCSPKGLRYLHIDNSTSSELYVLIFSDTLDNDLPKEIHIDSISKVYAVFKGWQRRRIENNSLKLAPLSHYTIMRGGGDASAHEIEIWTDTNSKVIRSSKEHCNN